MSRLRDRGSGECGRIVGISVTRIRDMRRVEWHIRCYRSGRRFICVIGTVVEMLQVRAGGWPFIGCAVRIAVNIPFIRIAEMCIHMIVDCREVPGLGSRVPRVRELRGLRFVARTKQRVAWFGIGTSFTADIGNFRRISKLRT